MKKRLIIFGLVLLLGCCVSSISAMAYQTRVNLIIELKNHDSALEPIEGYFDILFKISDDDTRFSSTIQPLFMETYPNYQTFTYLSDSQWISFLAYGGDDSYGVESNTNQYLYYSHAFYFHPTDQFKVVKIDADGQIESESEVIVFDDPGPFESLSVTVSFDPILNQFELRSIFGIRLLYCIFIGFLLIGVTIVLFLSRFGLMALYKSLHSYEKKLNTLYLFTTVPLSCLFVFMGFVYPEEITRLWMGMILLGILLIEALWIINRIATLENKKKVVIANYVTLIPYLLILLFIIIN